MCLSYDQMKNKPRAFIALTSLTREEFDELLPHFTKAYERAEQERRKAEKETGEETMKITVGRKAQLESMKARLLFILFYLKTYPIQEVLGMIFGMSQAQANEWIHRLAPVLKNGLDKLGYIPEQEGERLAEILAENDVYDVIQDGTERRCQRPKDPKKQKKRYSGKKKCHTHKNHLVIEPESGRICYLSETVDGSKHDKKLADESELSFPLHTRIEQDTGFQGYTVDGVIILQSKKKPKNKELSDEEKFINRCLSSARVKVENVIAGIKRCRIVKDVFRNRKKQFEHLVMELACGLHNLRVAHRSPLETINIVDFYFR